jgi:hypothetical protein
VSVLDRVRHWLAHPALGALLLPSSTRTRGSGRLETGRESERQSRPTVAGKRLPAACPSAASCLVLVLRLASSCAGVSLAAYLLSTVWIWLVCSFHFALCSGLYLFQSLKEIVNMRNCFFLGAVLLDPQRFATCYHS